MSDKPTQMLTVLTHNTSRLRFRRDVADSMKTEGNNERKLAAKNDARHKQVLLCNLNIGIKDLYAVSATRTKNY